MIEFVPTSLVLLSSSSKAPEYDRGGRRRHQQHRRVEVSIIFSVLEMSSPVQVKHEPGGDAFCVDTDSESEDIDIDKLQPLAPKFASLSKFPVGC